MLYLVLLLVAGSLGLLITALRTGDTLWAWTSVAVSVVAAVLLLFDWAGRRLRQDRAAPSAERATGAVERPPPAGGPAVSAAAVPAPERDEPPADARPPGTTPRSPGEAVPASGAAAAAAATAGDDPRDPRSRAGSAGAERPSRHHAAGDTPAEPLDAARSGYRPPGREAPAGAPGSVPVTLDPALEPPEEDTDAADALRVAELADEVRVLDERPRYHLAGCAWVGDRLTLPLPVHEARELGFSPCGLCRPDAFLCGRRRSSAG